MLEKLTLWHQFLLWLGLFPESVDGEAEIVPITDHLPVLVQDASLEVDDGLNTESILVLHGDIVPWLLAEGIGFDIKRGEAEVSLAEGHRCSQK